MRISVLVVLFGFLLQACNTIEGVGRDLGAAGDAISDTASDTKRKMNE